ncbi:cleavage polyadenylation factor subunit fip1 [Lambiella insularis]|nr:cleavage polyadenylation factor subunit fip1 [Lambiella insularis]
MEDDEDIYAPDENLGTADPSLSLSKDSNVKNAPAAEDGHEESEEEESDSDIDIITERQTGGKPEPPPQTQRVSVIKGTPARTGSPGEAVKAQPSPAIKVESARPATPTLSKSGSAYPPYKTSNIDVDVKPIYEPNGKPITEIDMDADFPEDDKPWRKPGTDTTDFFNYGFDEFTWASYCLKQESLRKEVVDQKRQMDEMQSLLGMPGAMPGPGMPMLPAAAAVPSMGGSADMPPELQQMMQSMMAQGFDPSQVDFNTFASMMAGNQANMGGQGYGQQGQQGQNTQQMGYGHFGNNSGGGNRNQGGRGQGRRW